MNQAPAISVIISVYNGEDYLAEAIESVCNQSFADWELIVINDCSTDGTDEILSAFAQKDPRIKVYKNETNLRLPSSLNKALSLAQGRYIARMDADDICLPDRLAKQFAFMESHQDVDLSSCRFMTLKNGVVASGGCGGKCDSESVKALLLVTNPVLHPGVIAKTEVIKQLGYDATCTCTEDLELWTRFVLNNYKIEILPEYLMLYRLHDKQITGTTLQRQREEVVKIQKKYFGGFLEEMTEEQEAFYIDGIYFREQKDVTWFCRFYRWLASVNKKTKCFTKEALAYAMFEILAEYKRQGLSKIQLIQAMLCFSPLFLLKEISDRKKRARSDGEKCILAAKKAGYEHTAGTTEFPIFSLVK